MRLATRFAAVTAAATALVGSVSGIASAHDGAPTTGIKPAYHLYVTVSNDSDVDLKLQHAGKNDQGNWGARPVDLPAHTSESVDVSSTVLGADVNLVYTDPAGAQIFANALDNWIGPNNVDKTKSQSALVNVSGSIGGGSSNVHADFHITNR
jgi:hypothetical protein